MRIFMAPRRMRGKNKKASDEESDCENQEGDEKDRKAWLATARGRYMMGIDLSPGNGKLFHQLALVANGQDMQKLYYYVRR